MKTGIVIIPTYNERENIQKVVPILEDVFKNVPHWNLGVLVVDDTSPDKTYDIVMTMQKKYKNLHLFVNQKKSGLGGAYLKGMHEAFTHLKADVVFEFDADLSHDPTKIPDFLKKIDEGYDMVLGSRYIAGGGIPQDWGWHRKLLSVWGNLFINIVLMDFSIRDWTGGYRAITKPVYNAVIDDMQSERFTGYTFQIGFLHNAVKSGFKIAEVPFHFVDRTVGESKMGMDYIKNSLLFILKVRLKDIMSNRIFKFVVVGGLGAIIQFMALYLFSKIATFLVADFFAIEIAILSNFLINNAWTFSDRKITIAQFPGQFFKFNVASAGSIVIQLIVAFIGKTFFGTGDLFMIPVIQKGFSLKYIYAGVGILLGMIWNFFAYNTFIWRKTKSKS